MFAPTVISYPRLIQARYPERWTERKMPLPPLLVDMTGEAMGPNSLAPIMVNIYINS